MRRTEYGDMDAGANLVLAVCGDGGSDAVAAVVILLGVLLWFLAVRIPLARAEDSAEGLALVVLLVGSVLLGAVIMLYPQGISGDADYLMRFFVSIAVTTAIALLYAALTGKIAGAWKAVWVALLGDVFVPGGLMLLLFASLAFGTGCLS